MRSTDRASQESGRGMTDCKVPNREDLKEVNPGWQGLDRGIDMKQMTDYVPKSAWIPEEANNISLGELLDGSISSSWFAKDKRIERFEDGRSRLLSSRGGPRLQRAWFSGRK